MAEKESAEETADDYEQFEQELEAVLSLDPVERINRYSQIQQRLDAELHDTDTEG